MPSLANEEETFENTENTDNTENTKITIKPLPELTIPKNFQVPQQTMFQKYWKFVIAILCILILLIVLVITVYSINKNPSINSQVITPTPMPMSAALPSMPTPSISTSTNQSNGFFNNLFGRKTETAPVNTATQVPIAVPPPVFGQTFLTNTVPKQEVKNVFNKNPEPLVPIVPKVGGGKGKGGKNNNSKGKSAVNSVSSTIKKAIKEMKKIKSGKLIKGGKIMKGGCGCDMQPNLLPNVNF